MAKFFLLYLTYSGYYFCYWAAPWPTLGSYQGDSPNHPILITESLVARMDPCAWASAQWALNQEPSNWITTPSPSRSLFSIATCLLISRIAKQSIFKFLIFYLNKLLPVFSRFQQLQELLILYSKIFPPVFYTGGHLK